MTKNKKIAKIHQKKKEGITIKPKYSENVNININKIYQTKYDKYPLNKHIKLVTNDVKLALFVAPITLTIGLITSNNALFFLSGSSLIYASVNIYQHKKEKQKKFTLKWAF